MPAKEYIVELDASEPERLEALIKKGKAPAKTILKARILLKTDQSEDAPGRQDARIVEALDTNLTMVMRVREKLVTDGARGRAHAQEAGNATGRADLRW